MCCHIVAQLQLDSGKQVVKTNSDFLNCGRTRDVVAHLYGKRGHFGLNDADGIGAPYKYKVSCCRLSWHRVHCVARASLEPLTGNNTNAWGKEIGDHARLKHASRV